MAVLAIDQGTTSTGAMVVDANGGGKLSRVIEHQQFYPQPGWVEHDPEELIASISSCIESNNHVSAIGIDNQGESCLAWHADTKEAISPVIVWQDNRTQSTIDRLKTEGVESYVLEQTGLPLDSYFSASKLAWIVETLPEAKDLLGKGKLRLGTTDAFFLDRLAGKFVTDITTASRTSLMNLKTGQWDKELCRIFGVPMDALPAIVPTTGDFGVVSTKGKHIPITASIVDQQASLYGHGCRERGDAKVTFGTGAFALTVTGNDLLHAPDKGLLPTIAWQLHGEKPVYALDGGVYCASSAINWARSLGLFHDFADINTFDGPSAIERNLAFVPALTGLACPHWDRSASGLWIGLSLDTGPLDMVRAIIEGVAFRAAEVLTAMDQQVPRRAAAAEVGTRSASGGAISIDGGMTANPYFCQFLSTVLNREVIVPGITELTAFGTAMLAQPGVELPEVTDSHRQVYYPARFTDIYSLKFNEAVERSKNWNSTIWQEQES